MKDIGKYAICVFLMGLMVAAGTPVRGQESGTAPSLGEVARKLKAEREKEKQKPVAVFTNDNLPSHGSLGIATVKLEEGAKEKQQTAAKGAPASAATKEHGEEYFRKKADKIRSRTELHRRQLAVLQQQLGLTRMQYYPNPQKTLEQESTPAFQTDLDKLRTKIAEVQKSLDDDQEAMDNLQQELRRAGGSPGWIR